MHQIALSCPLVGSTTTWPMTIRLLVIYSSQVIDVLAFNMTKNAPLAGIFIGFIYCLLSRGLQVRFLSGVPTKSITYEPRLYG